jgi:hypothetical protein
LRQRSDGLASDASSRRLRPGRIGLKGRPVRPAPMRAARAQPDVRRPDGDEHPRGRSPCRSVRRCQEPPTPVAGNSCLLCWTELVQQWHRPRFSTPQGGPSIRLCSDLT